MAEPAPTSPPDINRGPEILATCGTLTGLAVAAVALRVWVRATITRQLGWDDGLIMGAAAIMLAEMAVIVPEVRHGAGRHVQHIRPASDVVTGLHLNFVTQPLCLVALCLAKVSVGLFLLRLRPAWGFVLFIRGVVFFTVLSAVGNLCEYSRDRGIRGAHSGTDQFSDGIFPMHTSGVHLGPLDTGWQVHPSKRPQICRFLQL